MERPWLEEPNEAEWTAYGLPCRVLRNEQFLILNGYVGVPPGHALYEHGLDAVIERKATSVTIDEIDIINLFIRGHRTDGVPLSLAIGCHRGLSFSGRMEDRLRPEGHWWFGFDTAHAGDLVPAWAEMAMFFDGMEQEYRNFDYVVGVTTELAEQMSLLSDVLVISGSDERAMP